MRLISTSRASSIQPLRQLIIRKRKLKRKSLKMIQSLPRKRKNIQNQTNKSLKVDPRVSLSQVPIQHQIQEMTIKKINQIIRMIPRRRKRNTSQRNQIISKRTQRENKQQMCHSQLPLSSRKTNRQIKQLAQMKQLKSTKQRLQMSRL